MISQFKVQQPHFDKRRITQSQPWGRSGSARTTIEAAVFRHRYIPLDYCGAVNALDRGTADVDERLDGMWFFLCASNVGTTTLTPATRLSVRGELFGCPTLTKVRVSPIPQAWLLVELITFYPIGRAGLSYRHLRRSHARPGKRVRRSLQAPNLARRGENSLTMPFKNTPF